MSLERQAALMVFAEVANQPQVASAVAQGAGGIFIGTGATDLLQTKAFVSTVTDASPQPFVATDEEGGRVQRLASRIGSLPSARTMHATLTPAEITATVQRHAEKMHRLGVTMDFAPDADVSDEPADAVIGDRSFSNDPQAATADAVAFAKGLQAAGVTPVFKHFPGHGHGSGDSHTGLVTTPELPSLRTSDLVPYTTGLPQVPGTAVMVGHLIVPGLTNRQPASISRAAVTDLLRDEIGFDGLVITDDLGGMKGILDASGTPSSAAIQAARAGADLLLVPAGSMAAVVDGIVADVASGQIDRAQIAASAERILHALPDNRCG